MVRIQVSPFLSTGSKCYALVFVCCLFSIYMMKNSIPGIFYYSVEQLEELVSPFHCDQAYPAEAVVDFNTFDIFGEYVAKEEKNLSQNRYKVRKKIESETTEIYVLPFTHVDPGWLKTFGNYTYVTNAILDNMVLFLKDHPEMRFMWCEIAFFEHWWSLQNDSTKVLVRRYVSTGQLEIASGSWVMTDEATPYFPSTVDNIIEGQQFVYNELDVQSRVMWSNDPFGYGPSVPYLFTKTGVQWGIINRIHRDLKQFLQLHRAIPFRWRQHFDTNGLNDMYTHVLPYDHYDILNSCGPDENICCEFDFKRINNFMCPGRRPVPITTANIDMKAKQLEQQLHKMALLYETGVVLSVWGDDFRFDELEEWYQQYDNLMLLFNYINANSSRTKIRFGTFTDYFTALERNNERQNLSPATLSGDFFPYECASQDYWTGYYTTRPFYKRQERELHSLIRAADLLSSTAYMFMSMKNRQLVERDLTEARRNLALFQHHDAITGTSKNHVMKDYSERMFTSMKIAERVLWISLSSLIRSTKFNMDNIPLVYNESSSKKLIVVDQPKTILVYNSETYGRLQLIELLVSSRVISVRGNEGPVRAQIEPYFDSVTGKFTSNYLLVFVANLKPLSLTKFTIQNVASKWTEMSRILIVSQRAGIIDSISTTFRVLQVSVDKFMLRTPRISAILNPKNGLLKAISVYGANETLQLMCVQSFEYYFGSIGGAYVLRLNVPVKRLPMANSERFIVSGSVRQTAYLISRSVQQRLSVNNVEGPEGSRLYMQLRIDVRDLQRTELVTRFATDFFPQHTRFYTDSIGLQLIKRNEYYTADRPEMNYYPMPTALILDDSSKRLTVLSNVPHGTRTLNKTGFEIMLDRRLQFDDGKGLGLDDGLPVDNLPVNMAFTFVLEKIAHSEKKQQSRFAYNTLNAHQALRSLIYQPNIFITDEIMAKLPLENVVPFPCDVQLLTVRPLTSDPNLRLMVLHRAGIDCSSHSTTECITAKLDEAVKRYLRLIGASTTQRTLLNGVKKIGEEMDYRLETFYLEPMDFAAYLVRFG